MPMPPGPRPRNAPTMKDVAREAGVSKALVSIVFRKAPGASTQTRQKVLDAAERIGYRGDRGASLLALTRTRQLGIVHDLHNGFHAQIVDAALGFAANAGYQAVLSPRVSTRGELHAIDTALRFRCEALLLLGSTLSDQELREVAAGLPVVCIGRTLEDDAIDSASSSDEAGMGAIVDLLVAQGHRGIIHLDGGAGSVSARRRDGFSSAIARHGLEKSARVLPGGNTEADGFRAAAKALGHTPPIGAGSVPEPTAGVAAEPPTAIVAFNDLAALGTIDAALKAGLSVPDDVSITGYDDSPIARTQRISLTSVRQDGQRLGSWAVGAAIERLDEGRTSPRILLLEPELQVRGTTGPVVRSLT